MSDAQSAPLDKDTPSRRNRRRRGAKGNPRTPANAGMRSGQETGAPPPKASNKRRTRPESGSGPVFAAIDLGTNTFITNLRMNIIGEI